MQWIFVLALLFPTIFTKTLGLDIVFNFPGKLTYNKEHSVILTVFHANVGDRLSVSMDLRNQGNNRQLFWQQMSYVTSSPVSTYRLPVRANPLSHEWNYPGPTDDVMCSNTIQVSVATSSGPSWSHTKVVSVVKKRGHIFIQTDRPVYRPGDEVYVRFIPVDETLRPLNYPMAMSIAAPNPKLGGLPLESWKKRKAASNTVFVRSFRLPDTPPLGQWTVRAKFYSDDIVHNEFTSLFYVQEFTLPTFELGIRPIREAFILPEDENFSIGIYANFIYGEPVKGTAHVRFGLIVPGHEGAMRTTHIISDSPVQRGTLELTVPVANITGGATALGLADVSARLFIEASVTDVGGGRTRSLRNSDVIFTSSPLVINLERTATYYKPGLPFTIRALASYVNGTTANFVQMGVVVTAQRSDGSPVEIFNDVLETCSRGMLSAHITAPAYTNSMTVSVRGTYTSASGLDHVSTVRKELRPQVSTYGEYIQIVVPENEFAVGVRSAIEIYLTPTARAKTIVYTITSGQNYLAKGKVEAEAERSQVMVSFPVVAEMSPTSHMTAYYVTQSPAGMSFIIADSAILRVEETCQGIEPNTNVLMHGEQLPLPGQNMDIEVNGEPSSYIGVTGVDMAALSLRSQFADDATKVSGSTRSNAFDILRSFSPGCKIPTTPTPESAFPAIGRVLVTSVSHNFLEASNARCDDNHASTSTTSRTKRSIFGSGPGLVEKAARFAGVAYECCAIGSNDVSSVVTYKGNTCEQRAATVTLSEGCRVAFLECCKEAECIRENPTVTRRPCINVVGVVGARVVTSTVTASTTFTGFDVVERAVQLLRKNFAHTWFNADFQLGETGRAVLGNSTSPRIPTLPDSITAWSVGTFSISPERGMCISEPLTFAVEHSLFIEVDVPRGAVVRGTKIPVEVTLFSYLPSEVQANVIMEAEDNLCTGVQLGRDSETISRRLQPSQGGVASTAVVRFFAIPLQQGDYKIKVKLLGYFNGNEQPRIDKVVKVLRVVSEGEPQRQVQWLLIDTRSARFKRRGVRHDNTGDRTRRSLNLAFPANSIPGSEKASIDLHTLSSAFLREPAVGEDDGTTITIAQYLYKLQFTIAKLQYAKTPPSESYLAELTSDAQTAYDGLLTYARDQSPVAGNTDADETEALYGFSYSPADASKPDLWLTCATLRALCGAAELVEVEPDKKILAGSLRWILSHQDRRGYFTSSAEPVLSRRRRSSCSQFSKSSSGKRTRCNKREERYGSFRQFKKWQKKCRKQRRRCRRRRKRNAESTLQRLPQFANNLERKIYRTSVVSSFLASVLSSADIRGHSHPSATAALRPHANVFTSMNTRTLRNSMRQAMRYLGAQVLRNRSLLSQASPVTLAAACKALFILSGRQSRRLEEAVANYRMSDGESWWIKTRGDVDVQSLSPVRMLQVQSANVEATAYMLHFSMLRGIPGDNYATWLLNNRDRNNRWVSLRDSLAAMEGLAKYVMVNTRPQTTDTVSVEINTPGLTTPHVINPQDPLTENGAPSSGLALPVTNNEVTMTTVGNGRAWLESDVQYNMPVSAYTATLSTLTVPAPTQPLLCPYHTTVFLQRAPIELSTFFLRSAVSDTLWQVNMNIRFKSDYDPSESEDSTYVVDFGLHSAYAPIAQDLEKLSNSIEKAVDHYRISQRALLLYMSGERNISFRIRDTSSGNVPQIPIRIYPAAFPERKCTSYYAPPGISEQFVILCSNDEAASISRDDVCVCASDSNCPKFTSRSRSSTTTTEVRLSRACDQSVKYVYKARIKSMRESGVDWTVFQARIQTLYRTSSELVSVRRGQTHTFWLKITCPPDKLVINKEYLITGTNVVEGSDGVLKHLLDSNARIENWPGRNNDCDRISNPSLHRVCQKMIDFDYQFRRNGCPS